VEDVSLTFDNKMFLKGLEQISKQLETLTTHTEKSADKMSKGISMSAMSFIKINAALSMAKMGISKLLSNIPELGQTFKIAGDIITRNFLWPLRQQLMPYLQKFLNWVRDHRAMFVRWGGVLQSVFNMVVTGIKAAINILKPFYDAAMKFFKGIFGGTADSIDKIVNIMLFKISAVMIYLEAVLRPIMENLAHIMVKIAQSALSFAEGFGEAAIGMSNTWPMIKGLIEDLKLLSDALFGSGEGWKTMGKIIGYTVIPFLDGVLLLLRGIVLALTTVAGMGGAIGSLVMGDKKGVTKSLDTVSQAWGGDTSAVTNKKIEDRQADLELQEKFKEKLASKAQQQKIDNSRNFNVSSLVIHANTAEQGKEAADAFYIQAKKHVNISQSAKGH
jgi:hypothetical protein